MKARLVKRSLRTVRLAAKTPILAPGGYQRLCLFFLDNWARVASARVTEFALDHEERLLMWGAEDSLKCLTDKP